MRYLRADFLPYNDWGECTFFFEFAEDGQPLRQMEMYENGTILVYTIDRPHDDYGALADSSIHILLGQANVVPMVASEFEELWTTMVPTNLS